MTTKEQAEKLVNEYWNNIPDLFFEEAKDCALILVDNIIKELLNDELFYFKTKVQYWQEVKREIEKL